MISLSSQVSQNLLTFTEAQCSELSRVGVGVALCGFLRRQSLSTQPCSWVGGMDCQRRVVRPLLKQASVPCRGAEQVVALQLTPQHCCVWGALCGAL
jgi:hypothetical protein